MSLRFNLRTVFLAMLVVGVLLGIAGRSWRDFQLDQIGNVRLRQVARAYLSQRLDDSPPGLSWRVHLLPSLGEETLYRKFRLDEPWDSPHNLALLAEMPDVYRVPESSAPPGQTAVFYQEFEDYGPLFRHGYDDQCVPWTKPEAGAPARLGSYLEGTSDPRGVRRQFVPRRGG